MRGQDFDADLALAQAGLSMERLQSDDRFVDATQMRSLMTSAAQLSQRPWLGLEFGAMAQVFMHGPVGYAIAASTTLRQASAVLARFLSLRTTAIRLELEIHQRETDLIVVELFDMQAARTVLLETVLIIAARLMQTLHGLSCADVHYYLPWAAQYQIYFSGMCHFDATHLMVRVPTELLDSSCLSADADAFNAAYQACEVKLEQAQLVALMGDRVRARLLRCEGSYPSLAMLAAEQAMSVRSMMRRLKTEGTCFQDILDQVRFERARWHLLHTDAPMEEIAERLGLQDTSNFSRSFRRWSGVAPSEFRAKGLGPGPH